MSVQGKVVIRKSRRGNVVALAREHYLRDDIGCGSALCRSCKNEARGAATGRLGALGSSYIIPDISAVLNQHDVILSGLPPFKEVLFLQTVLTEVRTTSAKIYAKVKEALTTPTESADYAIFSNEHHRATYVPADGNTSKDELNQKSIIAATKWLQQHWQSLRKEVILLTDTDLDGSNPATEGLKVMSVEKLVSQHEASQPKLRELVRMRDPEEGDRMDESDGKRRSFFPNYMPLVEAQRKVNNGKLFQGAFSASTYNRTEGYVNAAMDSKQPAKRTRVLVQSRENMNRAVNGDVVIVELLPKKDWKRPSGLAMEDEGDSAAEEEEEPEENHNNQKDESQSLGEHARARGSSEDQGYFGRSSDESLIVPTGRIVAVAKRNWRPYGGSIDAKNYNGGEGALFLPAERGIPKIRIRSKRVAELLNKRLQVVIDSWDRNSVHPRGHILREIGSEGDVDTETEMLLLENDIPIRKFSETAMDCLPKGDWKVTEDNVRRRWDFRSKCIVSVDPPGCTDIDDALHCIEKEDGTFEVGVHIADVTAFLRHGSALDQEALERGTTVYLVDRRIEMLPSLLTSNLCSLMGEVERLAFSVIFHMDKDANEIGVEYGRSVIKSARAMTYQEAQERIDAHRKNVPPKREIDGKIAKSLCGLAALAAKLRNRRVEDGALSLASPEVKFKFQEETHEITDVHTYEIRETNRMVEEFMLLANIAVAKKLLRHFPQCAMLRRHPRPLPEHFDSLLKTASSFGVELDVSSSKTLNDSLNKAEKTFGREDSYMGTLLRILTTRCMTQAVYFSSGEVSFPEYTHYGLAAPIYTHFTSPIRRYADVVVHRLLSSSLGYSALPEDLQNSKKIQEYAETINHRHRCAQYAARASISLHTTLFLKGKENLVEDARIIRLLKNALVVLVPRFGIEGVAYLDPMAHGDDDSTELDEEKMTLKCRDGRQFRIMQTVRVRVNVDTKAENRQGVTFELVQT